MTRDCEDMLKSVADELFALSLILALLEHGEERDPSLASKGLAAVTKCQKLVRESLGQPTGRTQH